MGVIVTNPIILGVVGAIPTEESNRNPKTEVWKNLWNLNISEQIQTFFIGK